MLHIQSSQLVFSTDNLTALVSQTCLSLKMKRLNLLRGSSIDYHFITLFNAREN